MIIKNQLAFRIFSQSLFLIVLAFSCFSVSAQQTNYFQKPEWLQCNTKNIIQNTILSEYGSVFVSQVFINNQDVRPPKCYLNQREVSDYLKKFKNNKFEEIGEFYLHKEAKEKLQLVFDRLGGYINVARNYNRTTKLIKSKNKDVNDDWAQRDFADTKNNWKFGLKNADIESVIKNSYSNIYFAAIPGSSQHHFGLAIDVNNGKSDFQKNNCQKYVDCKICDENCVRLLNENGWFRTVRYDAFHFTYLGWSENKLSELGLKRVSCKDKNFKKDFIYWVPKLGNTKGKDGGCKDV